MKKWNKAEFFCYLKGTLFTGIFVSMLVGLFTCFIYSVVTILKGNTVNFFKLMDILVVIYVVYVFLTTMLFSYFITHKKFFAAMLKQGYFKKLIKYLLLLKWE